jgi:hypothetical protein
MQQEFLLTRSNYYSQFFNTAIFFDPFRIYFNSAFENLALEIYYNVQNYYKDKTLPRSSFYILLYPDTGLFEKSFGHTDGNVLISREGTDLIIGVKNPAAHNAFHEIVAALDRATAN